MIWKLNRPGIDGRTDVIGLDISGKKVILNCSSYKDAKKLLHSIINRVIHSNIDETEEF